MPEPLPRRVSRLSIFVALAPLAPAAAQSVVQPYATPPVFNTSAAPDPATELGRFLRELAANPRDLAALIGAGRAALAAGDANAAIGFYGRADEASPGNARVKAGLGAAMVQLEQPREALRLFDQAVGAGMPPAQIATDRGLAYDLRGENHRAQAEYQLALRADPRDDEATRRYALSLAISGDRNGALALLDPLMRRQDKAAWRASAFVLALAGDATGAVQRTELLLPRPQAAMIAPFFPRLAALSASQKASAVHFGRFPGDGRPLPDTQLADNRYGPPPGGLPSFPSAFSPTFRTQVPDSLPDGSPVTAVTGSLPDRPGQLPSFVTVRSRDRMPSGSPLRPAPPVARARIAPAGTPPPVALATAAPSASLLVPTGRPLAPLAGAAAGGGSSRPVATTALRPASPPAGPAGPPLPVRVAVAQPNAAPPASAAAPSPAPGTITAVAGPPAGAVPASSAALAPIVTAPAAPILIAPPPAPTLLATAPASPAAFGAIPSPALTGASSPPAASPSPPVRIASIEPVPQPAIAAPVTAEPGQAPPPATSISPGTPPAVAPVRVAAAEPPPKPPIEAATTRESSPPPVVRAAPPPTILDLTEPTAVDRVERSRSRRPAATASGGTTDDLLAVSLPGDLPSTAKPKKTVAATSDKTRTKSDDAPTKAADTKAKKAEGAKAAASKAKADKDAAAQKTAAKKAPGRYWVQVATGANKADLPKAWAGVKAKYGAQLAGRTPWTTPLRFTNRLLVGPFKSAEEAQAFVNTASKAGLGASTFASPAGQAVEKLGSQ